MTCYILASWLSGVESSGESNMEIEGKDDKSRIKAALIAVLLVEGVLLLFAFHVAYSS
ncbi:hypothetical protein Scep_030465 [Stephania cephalantha]|uniref:Uncharacterized protein n=1 Tax=Stephania cephalantha TaxID=152367 RepID=A0AAP0E7B2_9MAGN